MNDLTPDALRAIDLSQKLLAKAASTTFPEEAASATAKAMELLAAHNLDMSIVEQGGGKKAARGAEYKVGGLYRWQRSLWRAVAELNFCMYWNLYERDDTKINKYRQRQGEGKVTGGYVYRHKLIGRKVNIVQVHNMAEYLEQTIERMTRAWEPDKSQWFTRRSKSFREGMADTLISKLNERRREYLREEERKAAAARANSGTPGTGLTIAGLAKSEYDANIDFMYGEGTSARWAAEAAERIARREAAAKEAEAWDAAHPEEAAKRKAEEAREAARHQAEWDKRARRARPGRAAQSTRDEDAYWDGREEAQSVGLDGQIDKSRVVGALK